MNLLIKERFSRNFFFFYFLSTLSRVEILVCYYTAEAVLGIILSTLWFIASVTFITSTHEYPIRGVKIFQGAAECVRNFSSPTRYAFLDVFIISCPSQSPNLTWDFLVHIVCLKEITTPVIKSSQLLLKSYHYQDMHVITIKIAIWYDVRN